MSADAAGLAAASAGVDPDADHAADYYADAFLRDILREVKTIAVVGASTNENRPSFFAMKYLQKKGYRVIPVNPRAAGETLLGEPVLADLADLPGPVDMVDVFRNSDAAGAVVDQALTLSPPPKAVWLQLGVVNHDAAARAEAAGVRVVMNRCPKIEYARLSGELSWNGINSRVISAKKRGI
ncbi:MAG: CoA-binding protein [Marivibrio sp.]|uniref:CoA-binding protein n=1 Tax=Marivibrio sp. TaxID=2039719 RepID=UPI0032EFBB12